MALQVWLPMVSNFNNQGLYNSVITNNNVTLDNNGKLGKCGNFTGSNYLSGTINLGDSIEYTLACWVKPPAVSSGNKQIVAIASNSGWVNCRATMFYRQNTAEFVATLSNGTDSLGYTMAMTAIPNAWQHIAVTFKNKTITWYSNGVVQKTLTTTINPKFSDITAFGVGAASNGAEKFTGYINDVRIYDSCLSPKEVKELAKGLVCHYPLSDRSNQTPNNVATYPTFDTSLGHGNWSHWGGKGNLGHYSQNTDSQYIFRSGQTYSHCFSDESTATAPYLLFQSPSFSGGYRSLCAIIKEENGAEIKESIVYPEWNAAVSGSIPIRKWTSITPLGNGFYLCKVEGFQQDGSNNLVGIYVNAGYKVYVSEFYIENDRTVCSDFFYPSTTVYDTSGFKNNGETYAYDTTGSIECSSDTARYSLSTFINSANVTNNATGIRYIYGNCELTTPQYLTVAFWCKPIAGYGNYAYNGLFALTNNDIGTGAATDYNTAPMHNRDAYIDMCTSTNVHKTLSFSGTLDEWHHYAVVYDGRYGKAYIDGVQTATLDMNSNLSLASFKAIVLGYSHAGGVYRKLRAYYSDFRLYVTALSAEQIAELYNTAVSVANNGTLMGYEFMEV